MKNFQSHKKGSLNSLRTEIQKTHLLLIVIITILLSVGGTFINIKSTEQAFDKNLYNTADLISRLYSFTYDYPQNKFTEYFNSVCKELPDVDVVSIVGQDLIRIYHTNNNLIGTAYNGNIPDFAGGTDTIHNYDETGPSGPQRRSYFPIYDANGHYIGFIMTIILKTSISSVTKRTILLFLIVTIFAILIELAISETVSRRVKQKLLGFEPDTFSSMFKIRDNILESINDGVIAIDDQQNIQFINNSAKTMLNYSGNEKLDFIKEKVFTEKFIAGIFKDGKSIFGVQEKTATGTELLIDCIPVKKDEKITGVVAILHDRTEYTKLMEDLSGTKYLVDSMRANNHDFTNKLHVILGLIQIGEYDKAVSYIENISIIQRETLSNVMHSVDNASVAALLIGKIARASECNVKFILKDGTRFKNSDIQVPSEALVTICGNLIDNALDAMNMATDTSLLSKELVFGAFTKPGELLITVDDTGCGISETNKNKIFDNGFSTKGTGRGVGLYHTKQLIESLGGSITFVSQEGSGTTFIVSFKQTV